MKNIPIVQFEEKVSTLTLPTVADNQLYKVLAST